ncbi:MAG: hypothetical protein A4E57_02602 [Syntrophorhabdaceae bacterium PtaU1.Bin034]|nr:MAG: hypothetical protein A4E57_02602 [Syntrophorhabdaceae bacterium PtaU1.Bin034]
MRFFHLLDYQHWLLGLFLGLVLAIILYLAFTAYRYSSERADERAQQDFRYPDGIRGKNFPAPAFIIFIYVGFIVWTVCYIIFVGVRGPI